MQVVKKTKLEKNKFFFGYLCDLYDIDLTDGGEIKKIIFRKDFYLLKEFLKQGGDPNIILPQAYTPLSYISSMVCSDNNDFVHDLYRDVLFKMFKILLKHGADPTGKFESSYLNDIVSSTHPERSLEIFRLLVKNGGWFLENEMDSVIYKILIKIVNSTHCISIIYFKMLYLLFKKRPDYMKKELEAFYYNSNFKNIITNLEQKKYDVSKENFIREIIDTRDFCSFKNFFKCGGDPNEFFDNLWESSTPLKYLLDLILRTDEEIRYPHKDDILFRMLKILLKYKPHTEGSFETSYLFKTISGRPGESLRTFNLLVKNKGQFFEDEIGGVPHFLLHGIKNSCRRESIIYFKMLYTLFKKKSFIRDKVLEDIHPNYIEIIEIMKLKYNKRFYEKKGKFLLLSYTLDKTNLFYKENFPLDILKEIYWMSY